MAWPHWTRGCSRSLKCRSLFSNCHIFDLQRRHFDSQFLDWIQRDTLPGWIQRDILSTVITRLEGCRASH